MCSAKQFLAGIMNKCMQLCVLKELYVCAACFESHYKFIKRLENMATMKNVKLPGPESRIVMFKDAVFKLKYQLRSAEVAS